MVVENPGLNVDRSMISACIITLNEEDRIADCLRSVDWCDEIVVVDSHSTDSTRAIALRHGARVIERDWPGHVAQKEFTTRSACHDWVFSIDADERVSPPLRAELLKLREQGFPGAAAWRVSRVSCYLGRWIRHGSWFPDPVVRLFDRRQGSWGGHDPHDRWESRGKVQLLAGELMHIPYRSLSEHLRVIDAYSNVLAEGMHRSGQRARVADLVLRPSSSFVRSYVLRAGFLDGWRGLLLACLTAHYVQMRYAKLLALRRAKDTISEHADS